MSLGIHTAMPAFTYDNLRDPSKQVRVLTILPVLEGEDAITCSLEHVELEKGGHACLSYCWGEDEATHIIHVNRSSFSVRPNLYRFLLRARNLEFSGPLWVDAICINQADNDEKSVQVQLMGDIYSFATNTIVWLSVCAEVVDEVAVLCESVVDELRKWRSLEGISTDHLFSEFNVQLEAVSKDCWHYDSTLQSEHPILFGHCDIVLRLLAYTCASLLTILSDPYWDRTWIVQEIVLSSNASFLTSGALLPVRDVWRLDYLRETVREVLVNLEDFKLCSDNIVDDFLQTEAKIQTSNVSGLMEAKPPLSPGEAFKTTKQTICADRRDRIFGPNVMLAPPDRFRVDYNMSCITLFHGIIIRYIQSDIQGHVIADNAENLLLALGIRPSPIQFLRSIEDSLKSQMHMPSAIVWALSDRDSNVSPTVAQRRGRKRTRREAAEYGFYLLVRSDESVRIIFEFIAKKKENGGSSAICTPRLASDTPWRAWTSSTGQWELFTDNWMRLKPLDRMRLCLFSPRVNASVELYVNAA